MALTALLRVHPHPLSAKALFLLINCLGMADNVYPSARRRLEFNMALMQAASFDAYPVTPSLSVAFA